MVGRRRDLCAAPVVEAAAHWVCKDGRLGDGATAASSKQHAAAAAAAAAVAGLGTALSSWQHESHTPKQSMPARYRPACLPRGRALLQASSPPRPPRPPLGDCCAQTARQQPVPLAHAFHLHGGTQSHQPHQSHPSPPSTCTGGGHGARRNAVSPPLPPRVPRRPPPHFSGLPHSSSIARIV